MKTDVFASRHIGIREDDLQHMLKTVAVDNLEQLIFETIPEDIRLKKPLQLDAALGEHEILSKMEKLGDKNKVFKFYIG